MLASVSSDTSIASEIRRLVAGYLDGHLARRDLDRQLARFTRAIYDGDEPEATRLYGAARRLLTERGDGYRTEDELRLALRKELDGEAARSSPQVVVARLRASRDLVVLQPRHRALTSQQKRAEGLRVQTHRGPTVVF